VPAGSVDETFAPWEGAAIPHRAVYDAIMRHIDTLGEVHLDAVGVGVFLKRERKMAEIRPKARSLNLALATGFRIADERISQRYGTSGGRWWSVIKLTRVEDVDEQVRSWITAAFVDAGEG
jgi:hypothetical protein